MENVTPERWLWIPGFEGRYQVSDLGRVVSFAKSQPRLLAGTLIYHGTYRMVDLGIRRWRVHRLVMLAFAGPCPDGMVACHKNGNGLDNRLVNLYYGTPSQNNLDSVRHGTHVNARKAVCKCGREYDMVRKAGGRQCSVCHARYERERYARRKTA